MPKGLGGRRIVITGAASGMGHAIAKRFAEEGAVLGVIDMDEAGLRDLDQTHIAIDITDFDALTEGVAKLAKQMGGIDGLVNAAGILRTAPIEQTDVQMWRRIHDVNLLAPAQLCRLVIPHLRAAGGGTIVNIASLGGLRPNATMAAYAASKGGLIAFTKVLAAELAPDIRANALCPGFIATPMTDALYTSDRARRDVTLDRLALKRAGTPEEVAAMALFLTSAESSFTTGAVLTADGGSSWH